MTPYSRCFLRDRFLAEQQEQLRRDAGLDDPTAAYRRLIEELWRAFDEDAPVERAA